LLSEGRTVVNSSLSLGPLLQAIAASLAIGIGHCTENNLYRSLCIGRLESMCLESICRARTVIDGMIQQTVVELETGGNVRFEYGKPSDPWYDF